MQHLSDHRNQFDKRYAPKIVRLRPISRPSRFKSVVRDILTCLVYFFLLFLVGFFAYIFTVAFFVAFGG